MGGFIGWMPLWCLALTVSTKPFFLPITLNKQGDIILDHVQYKTLFEFENHAFLATFLLQIPFRQYIEDKGLTYQKLQKQLSDGDLNFTTFSFELDEEKYKIVNSDQKKISEICDLPSADQIYAVDMKVKGSIRYLETTCKTDFNKLGPLKEVLNLVMTTSLKYSVLAPLMNSLTCPKLKNNMGTLTDYPEVSWHVEFTVQNPEGGPLCL
jgi:hypothetical protein